MNSVSEHRFVATRSSGEVSALWQRPANAHAAYVLAHGAGADMRHRFMETIATALADRGVATFRYQFPYTEQGRRSPSPRPILLASVRSAVAEARRLAGDLPLFAGGKSMGGRMTSLAVADEPLVGLRGLVFLGFPLHAAGKPGIERGDHLVDVSLPMLFLQGSRDKLADLALLEPICEKLRDRATLHVCDGADHSFHVLKRSGRDDAEVRAEVADTATAWMRGPQSA